jgi:hypothetical protein
VNEHAGEPVRTIISLTSFDSFKHLRMAPLSELAPFLSCDGVGQSARREKIQGRKTGGFIVQVAGKLLIALAAPVLPVLLAT